MALRELVDDGERGPVAEMTQRPDGADEVLPRPSTFLRERRGAGTEFHSLGFQYLRERLDGLPVSEPSQREDGVLANGVV